MSTLTQLPMDFKGTKLSNRIIDEERPLVKIQGRPYRAAMLMFGAFFTESIEIRDATGRLLDQGTDYETVYLYDNITNLSGKEVMGWINVKDPNAVSPVKVTYQAVGGRFALSYKELVEIFKKLAEGEEGFKFEDIIGLPEAFPPSDHMHEIWQLIGLDTTVTELERIIAAIPHGMDAILEDNAGYGEGYLQLARDSVEAYRLGVMRHLNDKDNPHVLTPLQVGLDLINNWSMSTALQAKDPANDNTYLPIGHVQTIIGDSLLPSLEAHIRNTNNPHQTTADDVDSYDKLHVDTAYGLKLLWSDVAWDSALFGGQTWAQYEANVKTSLPARAITTGVFTNERVGGTVPGPTTDYAFTGNGKWTHWKDLLKDYNSRRGRIYFIGHHGSYGAAVAFANTTLRNVDDGSNAIAQSTWSVSTAESTSYLYNVMVLTKRNGQWT